MAGQMLVLLQELDELLEGVDSFASVDDDEDGPRLNADEESPGRAREIVSQLKILAAGL